MHNVFPDSFIDKMLSGVRKKLFLMLEGYLEADEKLIASLHETYIPRFDFRWLILTDRRIIVAIRKTGQFEFFDYTLNEILIDFEIGTVLFDQININSTGKKYQAQFYKFQTKEVTQFIRLAKKYSERLAQKNKGNQKESSGCSSVNNLRELSKLKNEGVITEEEFKEKKKELLNKI